VRVDRCHLEACRGSGVAVGSAVGLAVTGTTVRACDRGVGLSSTAGPIQRVRLVGNQLRGNRNPAGGGSGINLGERTDLVRWVLVQGNHLAGNAGPGIRGAAASLTVTANAFGGNGGGAGALSGGTGVIVANTCAAPDPGRLTVPATGFVVQANQLALGVAPVDRDADGPAAPAGGSSVVAHNRAEPAEPPPPVRLPRVGAPAAPPERAPGRPGRTAGGLD